MTIKIAIIGDCLSEQDAQFKKPFVGPAGQELDRILEDAGLSRSECYLTNVFNLQLPKGDISPLCVSAKHDGRVPGRAPLASGKYLHTKYQGEVDRLVGELEQLRPNLAVLLGNTACWALLDRTSVSRIRGACTTGPVLPWLKCLPTYHPSAILRQYDLRHVTVLDFVKARREAEFAELQRPVREVWLEPTLEDLDVFYERYLAGCERFTFDIETAFGQITSISFAPSRDRVLVIPFLDYRKKGGHYWATSEEEFQAWEWVARALSHPRAKSIGQNGLYDIQWLWAVYGIPVPSYAGDTMLLHHALQPESEKGLGFLGSVYTNEIAWKPNRPRGKEVLMKREDE